MSFCKLVFYLDVRGLGANDCNKPNTWVVVSEAEEEDEEEEEEEDGEEEEEAEEVAMPSKRESTHRRDKDALRAASH